MATVKATVQSRNSLSFSGLSTLASATYVRSSSAYNCSTNSPTDVIVEVDAATTNTPAGNTRVGVFIQESLDNSNFRSGPTSGTTTTDEPNLKLLGYLPLASSSVTEIGMFSVLQTLGYVPYSFYVVIKNDLGVALTSATVYTAEIQTTVA